MVVFRWETRVLSSPRRQGFWWVRPFGFPVDLRLGYPALPLDDPRATCARRLLGLLENGLASGLGHLLRTRSGLTYGVTADLLRRDGDSLLVIELATRADHVGQVIGAIRDHLSQLRSGEALGDSGLDPLWVNGAICTVKESPLSRLHWLHQAGLGLLPSEPLEYYRAMGDLTRVQLLDVRQLLFRPEDLRIVVLGRAGVVQPLVEGLGTVRRLRR